MEGMDWEGVEEFVGDDEWCCFGGCSLVSGCVEVAQRLRILDGTALMLSAQWTGVCEYLLVLWKPVSESVAGASPQRRCF